MSISTGVSRCLAALPHIEPLRWTGEVTALVGMVVESHGPAVPAGSFCEVHTAGNRIIRMQVVGFRNGRVLSIPLEETDGIALGNKVVGREEGARVAVGPGLLGRVLDGFGEPVDGMPRPKAEAHYELFSQPPGPLAREPVKEALATGIRVIDGLLTCGKGQRIGLFGGSGVGKSTLLGAMSRQNTADVTVIALIGERNREVRGFLDHELSEEARRRSVVIAATSDRPAPLRVRACYLALAVSEYFRDRGANVLLVMDSVTRLAMAQREIGLAAGEPPGTRGYPPSVFNLLPKLFERAGNFGQGSITGFFTVLVEGDDFNEPVCDTVRGILDGHVVLSRALGAAGHYPAVDVLNSVSRVMPHIVKPEHADASRRIRSALASYERSVDLIQLGAYVSGTNPQLDKVLKHRERLLGFLQQDAAQQSAFDDTVAGMLNLAGDLA